MTSIAETLNQVQIVFHVHDDICEIDFNGRPGQCNAPTWPPPRIQITHTGQHTDHFHQVVARNFVGFGDFLDRYPAIVLQAEIHENPK